MVIPSFIMVNYSLCFNQMYFMLNVIFLRIFINDKQTILVFLHEYYVFHLLFPILIYLDYKQFLILDLNFNNLIQLRIYNFNFIKIFY